MPQDPFESPGSGLPGQFATTRWSLVASVGEADDRAAREALEELCRIYWRPVRAYVGRWLGREEGADDLTQALFTDLLERGDLATARRERGRFRAFLLGCARHFLLAARRRERAAKRGGGEAPLSLDEDGLGLDPSVEAEAEAQFERAWALALLADAEERLRREEVRAGKAELFTALRPFLGGEAPRGSYGTLGERLCMTEGALRVAVHRLRRRFGELLREAVGDTVAGPGEVEEELARLRSALMSP